MLETNTANLGSILNALQNPLKTCTISIGLAATERNEAIFNSVIYCGVNDDGKITSNKLTIVNNTAVIEAVQGSPIVVYVNDYNETSARGFDINDWISGNSNCRMGTVPMAATANIYSYWNGYHSGGSN